MREYKPCKHHMGVEGPSFWREQQERRQQEQEEARRQQEQQGRDQPRTQEAAPKHQASMWETMFGIPPEEKTAAIQDPTSQPFQRRGLSSLDPSQWLDVPAIWSYVSQNRQYGGGAFAVDVLTRSTRGDLGKAAGEIAQFFGMSADVFKGLTLDDAWKQVIGPFLESLEQGMVRMKPFVIPGALRFEIDEEGKLLLVYQNR